VVNDAGFSLACPDIVVIDEGGLRSPAPRGTSTNMQKPMLSLSAVAISAVALLGRTTGCWPPPPSHGPTSPVGGDLAITEVMIEPQAGRPEWIELRSERAAPLDLSGCALSDGGVASHTTYLPPGIVLPPGGFLVIAEAELSTDGSVPSDVVIGEDELVLSEVDPGEVVSVHCPGSDGLSLVDQVPIGELGDGARGHSWMFESPGWASLDNDDPETWCLAPSSALIDGDAEVEEYGTPGSENACGRSSGTPPQEGDLQVTELMIAPTEGREWLELHSLSGEELDLAGCVLAEQGAGLVHEHTLSPDRGTTVIAPGEFLVLSASGLEMFGDGSMESDYEYSTLTFNNADPEELTLQCQGIEVERVAYDWSATGGERGQTLARDPLVAEVWCLGVEAIDVNGVTVAWGTPGAENPSCGVDSPAGAPRPLPGEVVITELMVAPSSGSVFPEWLEVSNIGEQSVDLDGCVVEDDGHSATLQAARGLAPGQVAVVAAGAFDPVCDVTVWGEYGGSVTFNNTTADRAALSCPDVDGGWSVIDEVSFDWEAWGLDKGTSLVLDADAVDASDNDATENWCAAPADAWSCEVDGNVDRGTPGFLTYCGG